MTYTFTEKICKQGNRYFIQIPFNVWEKCGQKGMIAVRVYIDEDCTFECRLVPKGAGAYYIPIKKELLHRINSEDAFSVSFELISGLTRIFMIVHIPRKILYGKMTIFKESLIPRPDIADSYASPCLLDSV